MRSITNYRGRMLTALACGIGPLTALSRCIGCHIRCDVCAATHVGLKAAMRISEQFHTWERCYWAPF
jgi:hypothetical protein